MKRKYLSFAIIAILLVCIVVPSHAFATTSKDTDGYYHEDGSYQFGTNEIARLNQYLQQRTSKNSSLTMADVIEYASPNSFERLSEAEKVALSKEPWVTVVEQKAYANRAVTYNATISKYGSSLKGYSYINRPSSEWLVTTCAIFEYPEQEYYVGYSYNTAEPTGGNQYVSSCSATVIIDPPSGTYWTKGQFSYPYFEDGLNHVGTLRATSSTLSYVNPNG